MNLKIGIILILLFTIQSFLFITITKANIYTNDNEFHYEKILGNCAEGYSLKDCLNYPSEYHIFARPFVHDIPSYIIFNLFVFAFIVPLLLYLLSKNIYASIIFVVCGLLQNILFLGIIPQAFIFLFTIIFYYCRKKKIILIGLIPFFYFSHKYGILLYFVLLMINILTEKKLFFAIFNLGNIRPPHEYFMSYFTQVLPLPFAIIGLIEFIKQKAYFELIAIISFIMVGIFFDGRIILFTVLFLIIGFSEWLNRQSTFYKVCIILIIAIWCSFIQYKYLGVLIAGI